jgi:hypothetical protein
MDELEMLAMADCLLAQQRFVATKPLRGHQSSSTADVSVQIPPGQVAGNLSAQDHCHLRQWRKRF